MNKKILAFLSFLIVIAGMSTAFAFDLNDLSDILLNTPDDNVTVCGIDFAVPDGFTLLENETFDNQPSGNPFVDYNISSKTLMNDSGDVIIISASSSSDLPADDDFAKDASGNGNKTTINGVEGYEFSDSDFESFTFAKDGKLVIISASDKNVFDDVVLA